NYPENYKGINAVIVDIKRNLFLFFMTCAYLLNHLTPLNPKLAIGIVDPKPAKDIQTNYGRQCQIK
ncbi:16103_t:CDS:2, partial [Acaulospora morrowiae]